MWISPKSWSTQQRLHGFSWLMHWVCLACFCGLVHGGETKVTVPQRIALLIIDVQNCFMPDRPLGAPEGDRVPHVINYIREEYESNFAMVALFQDWHCVNDVAFASQYPGKNQYDKVVLTYNMKGRLCRGLNITHSYATRCRGSRRKYRVEQILWPEHCVENSTDAEFVGNLTIKETDLILRKDHLCQLDTYSAFEYKGGFVETGLHEKLQENRIEIVFLTGLVLEYSIYYSALGATARNYSTYLVIDAIGNQNFWSTEPVLHDLTSRGVKIIESGDLSIIFENLARKSSNSINGANESMAWSRYFVSIVAAAIAIHFGYWFTGT